MKVRTKGNSRPTGKPRILFSCHPADIERSFDKICDSIFRTHDVAVYFFDIENDGTTEQQILETDLRQMNLFIIPVSIRYLTESNYSKDYILQFAKKENIPILPIMLDHNLKALYSKEDNFGTRHYLNLNSSDPTAISYEKKLSDYLDSFLIGDQLANRIRKAFDAYVFLSYRRKDRIYANSLMRMIHKDTLCRDIAIWYDEFLVPGEEFNGAITEAIKKSEVFTLLVTPNLVNEQNYVQSKEYPYALKSNIRVLPVEVVKTDRNELEKRFPEIPQCVKNEESELREAFLTNIKKIAQSEKNNDPEHDYLIGLAYLDGVDVEVDKERAVELITGAANAGLPEAMEKLADMYDKGIGVMRSFPLALEWYEKFVHYHEIHKSCDERTILKYQNILAMLYADCGEYDKAIDLSKKVYDTNKRLFGENDSDTLTSLNNLAKEYSDKDGMLNHKVALELHEQVYEARKLTLGEEHRDTLTSLDNLAYEYGAIENHEESKKLHERAYELRKQILGEHDPYTLTSLNNLAGEYGKIGNHTKALELFDLAYNSRKQTLGDDHPATLRSLNNLAYEYSAAGDYKMALKLQKQVYEASKRVLGENHPDTIQSLGNLANIYSAKGNHNKSRELLLEVYNANLKLLGEKHPFSIKSLSNLANEDAASGDYKKSREQLELVYELGKEVFGETHSETLTYLNNLAISYGREGNHQRSVELLEQAYDMSVKTLGGTHPETLVTLSNLASEYKEKGNRNKALDLNKDLYELNRRVFGEDHPNTLTGLNNLATIYRDLRNYNESIKWLKKIYDSSKQVLGESHPDTLTYLTNLAITYRDKGDHNSALDYLELAYTLNSRKFGKKDLKTQIALRYLAEEYGKTGNREKAKALFDELISPTGLR